MQYDSKPREPQPDATYEFPTPRQASDFADAVIERGLDVTCYIGHRVADVFGLSEDPYQVSCIEVLAREYGGRRA